MHRGASEPLLGVAPRPTFQTRDEAAGSRVTSLQHRRRRRFPIPRGSSQRNETFSYVGRVTSHRSPLRPAQPLLRDPIGYPRPRARKNPDLISLVGSLSRQSHPAGNGLQSQVNGPPARGGYPATKTSRGSSTIASRRDPSPKASPQIEES